MKKDWVKRRALVALRPVQWAEGADFAVGRACYGVLVSAPLSPSAKASWCALTYALSLRPPERRTRLSIRGGLACAMGPWLSQEEALAGLEARRLPLERSMQAIERDLCELERAGYVRYTKEKGYMTCVPRRAERRNYDLFRALELVDEADAQRNP
jgi:hypothetical protein